MLRSFRQWIDRLPDHEPAIAMKLTRAVYKLDQLPTLSETTVRAIALANDETATLKQFADLIRSDGAVATIVLKTANSLTYQSSRPLDSLDQAVVRIGMRGCKNLIASIGMRAIFRTVSQEVQSRCELLWQHSFLTASLASLLNQEMKLGLGGEEFAAGLLHDIGRLVVTVSLPDWSRHADPMDFREQDGVLQREEAILGTTHCLIGKEFAEKNHLPASIIQTIRYHHTPREAPGEPMVIALVSLADDIANHIQRESKISNYDPKNNPGYRLLTAKWDLARTTKFTAALHRLTVRAIKETRSLLKVQE